MIGASDAPVIDTPRLRLRGHRVDDFEASATMWGNEIVTRHVGGRTSTPPQAWARVLSYAGLWALLGYGYWAIEERASGTFVGEAGFADFKREIDERMRSVPEAGWAFVPEVHGMGYATEAVRAVNAWGDDNLESARTVCLIGPANAASLRVAQRCQFVEFGRTRYNDQPIVLLERRRNLREQFALREGSPAG